MKIIVALMIILAMLLTGCANINTNSNDLPPKI